MQTELKRAPSWARDLTFRVVMASLRATGLQKHTEEMTVDGKEKRYENSTTNTPSPGKEKELMKQTEKLLLTKLKGSKTGVPSLGAKR